MMPSLQSWGLTPASRLSPALRQSIQTRWATATGYCSFFLRTGSSLLNKDSTSTAIFCASSPQQMRFTTACLETRGAAESSSTSSRRAPPNATTLVKQLRERTAVSIGMCKRALEESNWVGFSSSVSWCSRTTSGMSVCVLTVDTPMHFHEHFSKAHVRSGYLPFRCAG